MPRSSATGDKCRSVQAIASEALLAGCKDFPLEVQRLIRWPSAKGKGAELKMPSELDRRFDAVLAAVIGPGGRLVIERDSEGRAIVGNFPATVPGLFRAFCELYADGRDALVAGEERLTFPDLDRISEQLALALAGRGIAKGDRVGIAMRNCPSWIVAYMAVLKAGGVATLLNGWWLSHELEHALALVEPRLTIADGPRAKRIEGVCGGCDLIRLEVDQPLDKALAP